MKRRQYLAVLDGFRREEDYAIEIEIPIGNFIRMSSSFLMIVTTNYSTLHNLSNVVR